MCCLDLDRDGGPRGEVGLRVHPLNLLKQIQPSEAYQGRKTSIKTKTFSSNIFEFSLLYQV